MSFMASMKPPAGRPVRFSTTTEVRGGRPSRASSAAILAKYFPMWKRPPGRSE